jgi:DNA-binding transcriptional regulator GbsR (MarR family)
VARYYMREQNVPPVAGRVLGYLGVCEPAAQTINDLSEALLASRSAITQAVVLLESRGLVQRSRACGERVDRVTAAWMPQHSSGTSTRLASPTRQHCSGAEPPC